MHTNEYLYKHVYLLSIDSYIVVYSEVQYEPVHFALEIAVILPRLLVLPLPTTCSSETPGLPQANVHTNGTKGGGKRNSPIMHTVYLIYSLSLSLTQACNTINH